MSRVAVLYFAFLLITFFVMGRVAFDSRRRRDVPGAVAFSWFCILIGLLTLFECLSMAGPTKVWALRWFDLRFITVAFAPVVWLLFVWQYTGQTKWIRTPLVAALFVVPAITQVMVWTAGYHGLWEKKPVNFYQVGLFFVAQTDARAPGVWMWVHLGYSYLLMMAGAITLAIASVRLYRQHQKGVAAILGGIMVITLGASYPILIPVSWHQFNPLTPSLAAGSLLLAWGMYRYKFLHAPPVFENIKRIPVLLSFILIALIACIILAAFLYLRYFEKNYRAGVARQLTSILNLKIHEIQHWRKERWGDAEVFYGNAAFVRAMRRMVEKRNQNETNREVSIWLRKVRSSYEYKNIFALDAQGRLLASAAPISEPLCREIAGQGNAVLESGNITFLDFHRYAADGTIHLSILVPILDGEKRIGLIALLIDPDQYLYPLIKRWPDVSRTAETLLVRTQGGDVQFLNDLRFQRNAALNLTIPLSQSELPAARAVKGERGIFEGIDYRGIPVLAVVDRVPDSPWFMIARIDLAEVNEPIQPYFWLMMILVGSLVAGSSAAVWILWQRQSRDVYRRETAAAEALKLSEEKFRKAFMTTPDAIAMARWSDGLLTSVNPGFCTMTGYTAEEIFGRKLPELDIWDNQKAMHELNKKLGAQRTLANEELKFHKKTGEMFYGLISASLMDINGEPHLLSITRDITKRKRAEERLRESEDIFKHVFEYSLIGKSITYLDGRINVNKALCALLGYAQEELNSRRWQDITHPDDVELTQEAIDLLLSGKRDSITLTKRFLHKNGSVIWAELGSSLRRDETGKPLYLMTTIVDITERKKAEEAIIRLNETLEERVRERTAELSEKNRELENLNRVFVDRELRMRELKAKIAELQRSKG